ncbi:GNAT family N-acetyltransferase [Streptomyces sp. NPDC059909]|uniref:GNAT family N-acetyltransferase n=1 Tax=Streptomyces sp. NPDC059909 TaxID=3346998 RepID=UPI00364D0CD8
MSVVLSVEGTASAQPLRLRPWCADDAEAVAAAHQDPVLRRWLKTRIDGEPDARRWIDEQMDQWSAGTRFSFAVLERTPGRSPERTGEDEDFGRPVGQVVVKEMAPDKNSAEVGYWVAAQARGRGVAPRALSAVSRWAFGLRRTTPLERLDLIHAVGNPASHRVAEESRFALRSALPALPPAFPAEGHPHSQWADPR